MKTNEAHIFSYSCAHGFYDKPTTRSPRATTLGYGRRFGDIINKSEGPSPQKYQIDSVDFSNKFKKGFHFGLAREHYQKVSKKVITLKLPDGLISNNYIGIHQRSSPFR